MKHSISSLLALCAMLLITSCSKNNDTSPVGDLSNSVFIVNEGPFQNGTGTIMALNRETGQVSNDLFEMANGFPLGNIVQSMTINNGFAYLMINNANKIVVVKQKDFMQVAAIEGLTLPRYMIGINTHEGLVSCWDNTVKYIDLQNYTVTESVDVGTGPDEMIKVGDKIFVLNSGGYEEDSTVSVFNYLAPHEETKILVGHHPAGIQEDRLGQIWVLCGGRGWNGFPAADDTPAKLVCLDPINLQVVKEFVFPTSDIHPDNLVINKNGDTLYYCHPAGIFNFSIGSELLNDQPFITSGIMFYGLGYDVKESIIYGTDPLDYSQNGYVYRYHASDGSAIDTIMAGVVPSSFCFPE